VPNPLRGEIWQVNWSPSRGLEQAGRRPSLVVQSDIPNGHISYANTIVVAISSPGRTIPSHVLLSPSEASGLDHESYAKCEQILTIAKDRLERRIGRVSAAEFANVERGLHRTLSLIDPPTG